MTLSSSMNGSAICDYMDATIPEWYEQVMNDIEPQVIQAQIQQFAAHTTHRQPYSYFKTAGAITGRERHEHEMYEPFPKPREKLPRLAAIIGAYLIREHQRCGHDWLVINNLSEVARLFNITPQKLKQYLVLLGGYEYYTVELVPQDGRKKRVVGIQQNHLFNIDFYFELEDGELPEDIIESLRTGTPRSWYAQNRRVAEVRVRPAERFRNELNTRPYAYVKLFDKVFDLLLDLDDMAFKLACFALSNKPKWSVTVSKLAEDSTLRLRPQINQQGYPRVQSQLEQALQTLQQAGLFTKVSCEPVKGKRDHKLTWECSEEYVVQKEVLQPQ